MDLTKFTKEIPNAEFIFLTDKYFECIVKTKDADLTFNFYYGIDYSNGWDDPQINWIYYEDSVIRGKEGESEENIVLNDTDFDFELSSYIIENYGDFISI